MSKKQISPAPYIAVFLILLVVLLLEIAAAQASGMPAELQVTATTDNSAKDAICFQHITFTANVSISSAMGPCSLDVLFPKEQSGVVRKLTIDVNLPKFDPNFPVMLLICTTDNDLHAKQGIKVSGNELSIPTYVGNALALGKGCLKAFPQYAASLWTIEPQGNPGHVVIQISAQPLTQLWAPAATVATVAPVAPKQ